MFLAMALGMMCSGTIAAPQEVVPRVQENMSVQKMLIASPKNKRFSTFDVEMEAKFDGMVLDASINDEPSP